MPPIGEQHDVVKWIEAQSLPLDNASTRLEREIELLREYRTRLVADVVTGKLDVREVARQLPIEAEQEDSEDSGQGEESEAEAALGAASTNSD
jgi:type I restriction enzyme S subunit